MTSLHLSGTRLAFAGAVAKPRGKALLIDADNRSIGWVPIREAVACGGAYAVDVRPEMLAIDAGSVRGPDAPGTAGPSSGPEAQAHGNPHRVLKSREDPALPSDLHPPKVFELSVRVGDVKVVERRDAS